MKTQIRVGIVGAGYMGREWARAVSSHPLFDLVGILSRSPDRAGKLAADFSTVVVKSIQELNQMSADSVIVAVPELALPVVFDESSNYDWTIVAEKPAGIDFEVARLLREKASKRIGSSFVALNRRFYSSTQELGLRLAHSQSPAEFLLVDQHDPIKARSAGQPCEVVDKWHFANAIHTLDLLRFIGRGEAEVVSTTRESIGRDSFVVKANLEFSSSDRATYISIWNAPGPWMFQCFTESEVLELRPLEQLWQTPRGSRSSQKIDVGRVDVEFKPGLWRMLDELSVFHETGFSGLPSFEDSLKSMSLVADVYEPRKSL
jgi:predicted dehydrogenase